MARHFKEQDIAEFRDCFSLYARNDYVDSVGTLMAIMRSLRTSPTIPELKVYLKSKNGKISFADFLEVMHTHTNKEKSAKEIQAAFRAADTRGKGTMSYKELHHILCGWGERLSSKEVDQIFREANIKPNSQIRYEEFIKVVTSPVPDYYF
uniref:EOG090X0GKM n=1 Tax=Simocephalus serrulatus TaxID=117539 RepID=A0A4Y7NR75_9CRUS|nr:EOG090X0GKM [Simocephalus serrulatus]SVE94575.1 EOG090X0GKM [Simocephalus serrulatus]